MLHRPSAIIRNMQLSDRFNFAHGGLLDPYFYSLVGLGVLGDVHGTLI